MSLLRAFFLSVLGTLLAAAPGARVHERIELPSQEENEDQHQDGDRNDEQKKEAIEISFRPIVFRHDGAEEIEIEADDPGPEPAAEDDDEPAAPVSHPEADAEPAPAPGRDPGARFCCDLRAGLLTLPPPLPLC